MTVALIGFAILLVLIIIVRIPIARAYIRQYRRFSLDIEFIDGFKTNH